MHAVANPSRAWFRDPELLLTLAGAALVVLLPWLQRWLYFWPELDHRLFLGRDFLELTSQRAYFYRALAQGKLALWDPLMATGLPFMDYLFDLFNPLSLLNVFFLEEGLLRSDYLQRVLIAYCSLAGLGAFLLGLQLGVGRAAATVMGCVMGCMGVVVAHSEHSMMIQSFCWLPLILLLLHRARHRGSLFNAAWAGVFLGWSFLGGIPQLFYYVGLAATLYAIHATVDEYQRGGWRAAWRWAAAPYLLMGLTSVIWALPNLAHLAGAGHGDPVGVHDASALVGRERRSFVAMGSGNWWILTHFLAPKLIEGHPENTAYVGILPLGLALMAVAWVRRREAGFYKLLGLVGIILMMGANLGLHKVLVDLLPGYYLFRQTVRWMFLLHVGLLVLAGYGLHWLLHRAQPPELATLRRVLAVLAALLVGLILLVLSAEAMRLKELSFGHTLPPLNLLGWLLFNLGVLWWAVPRRGQKASTRLVALVLVALVALDLGFYQAPNAVGGDPVRTSDPTQRDAALEAQAAKLVRLAGGPGQGRVLAYRKYNVVGYQYPTYLKQVNFINPPGGYMDRRLPLGFWQTWWDPGANPRYLQLWAVKLVDERSPAVESQRNEWFLCGYSQSAVRLEEAVPVSRLRLRAEALLPGQASPGQVVAWVALVHQGQVSAQWALRQGREVNGQPLTLEAPPGAKADAVVLASAHPLALVGISRLELDGRRLSDRPWLEPGPEGFLYNRAYLGRAWFVSQAAVVKPDWEYQHVLDSIDPSRSVVFRRPPQGWQPPQGLAPDPGGAVKELSWQEQALELEVKAQRAGWLVLSQSAHHGWRAYLDGKETPIAWAYGFMAAVAVPPGQHRVRLVYAEPWVKASLPVPPLLFLGLIAAWLICRRRRGKAAPAG